MKNKLFKIEQKLEFNPKRNYLLITPCCHKSNKDGKFSSYKRFPDNYGYCHSCGNAILPPTLYKDDKGAEFQWNDVKKCFEPIVIQMSYTNVIQVSNKPVGHGQTADEIVGRQSKYISKDLVLRYNSYKPESNLLLYMRKTYGDENTELLKNMYYIGSSKDGGTIFWNINENQKVQKVRVSYYTIQGKRTNEFKVPYQNKDGYFSCLYGEHLISQKENIDKPIILVESEKTAIICSLHLPEYVWLSYGGINGLAKKNLQVLVGKKVVLVPDISKNAIAIMKKKLPHLLELGIDAKIWDMTNGKTDVQLKKEGWYNCDLEDAFRTFKK